MWIGRGALFCFTESAIRNHWQHIFARMDVSNRTEAVTKALRTAGGHATSGNDTKSGALDALGLGKDLFTLPPPPARLRPARGRR